MTITINGTTGITNDGGYTGDGVVFADTTPANTLVTTTGGNVGIGASSPTAKLDIRAPNAAPLLNIQETDSGNGRRIRFLNSGTVNTIESTAGVGSTQLAFSVDGTERARIDTSGNLLVGTTSHLYANTSRLNIKAANLQYGASVSSINAGYPTFNVINEDVGGTRYFLDFRVNANGATGVGSITSTGSTTAYNTTSDYRLKEQVQPMQGALAKVAALKPVTYKWKSTGEDDQGFIAHELQEVFPSAVTGEKDAVDAEGKPVYQGIDTSFLVATLTAAIQEQQQLITALTARVAALDARLTSLEGK